jgi:hypothetical protein
MRLVVNRMFTLPGKCGERLGCARKPCCLASDETVLEAEASR